jgi:hypothetical protein
MKKSRGQKSRATVPLNNVKHSATDKQAYIHTLFTFHIGQKHSTTAKQTYIHILFKFHPGELKRPTGPVSFCQAHLVFPLLPKIAQITGPYSA